MTVTRFQIHFSMKYFFSNMFLSVTLTRFPIHFSMKYFFSNMFLNVTLTRFQIQFSMKYFFSNMFLNVTLTRFQIHFSTKYFFLSLFVTITKVIIQNLKNFFTYITVVSSSIAQSQLFIFDFLLSVSIPINSLMAMQITR